MDQTQAPIKKLYRSRTNRVLFGICGGLGEYFRIDPVIFRILFLLLTFGAGSGILLYLLLALVIPITPNSRGGSESNLSPERKEDRITDSSRNWLGMLIVFFGVALLFNQLFPLRFSIWGIFWPLLIVILGISILAHKGRNNNYKSHLNLKEQEGDQNPQSAAAPASEKKVIRGIRRHRKGIAGIFFGLLLIIIGFVYLAQNFGLISGINVNFGYLLRLWPIFIILIGLSILSRGTFLGFVMSIIFVFVIIGLILFSFFLPYGSQDIKKYDLNFPKDPFASSAQVLIKAGAASIKVNSRSNGLIFGSLESNVARLSSISQNVDNVQQVKIEIEGNVRKFIGKYKNDLTVSISEDIPLALIIDSGASNLDLDLASLRMENLKINSGAAKLNLILGNRMEESSVEIDAGASAIAINLPRDLGVKLDLNADLSSKNFSGLFKTGDKTYESNNYLTAQNKMNIRLNAGVSSISINWR